MVIKYNNIFYSKALQILPKLGFFVWKQTIWQPWWRRRCLPQVSIFYEKLDDFYDLSAQLSFWGAAAKEKFKTWIHERKKYGDLVAI
jgi:hypothetical protein